MIFLSDMEKRPYFSRDSCQSLARSCLYSRGLAPWIIGYFFSNVVGAVVWAGGFTLLGYFIGQYIPDDENYITPIILLIIGLTAIPVFITMWKTWKEQIKQI